MHAHSYLLFFIQNVSDWGGNVYWGRISLSGAGCGVITVVWFGAQVLVRLFAVKCKKSLSLFYCSAALVWFLPLQDALAVWALSYAGTRPGSRSNKCLADERVRTGREKGEGNRGRFQSRILLSCGNKITSSPPPPPKSDKQTKQPDFI